MGYGGRPRRYTRAEVVEALLRAGGNQAAAARLLGCDRVTVWRYLRRKGKERA